MTTDTPDRDARAIFSRIAARPRPANEQPSLVEFLPHETTLTLVTGPHRLIIAADTLLFWWGADSGPQTAEGLVALHLAEIEAIAMAKLADGISESPIIIGEDDLG